MQKRPHRAASVMPRESEIRPIRYLPRHVPVPSSGVASGAAPTHGRTACSARSSRRPGPPRAERNRAWGTRHGYRRQSIDDCPGVHSRSSAAFRTSAAVGRPGARGVIDRLPWGAVAGRRTPPSALGPGSDAGLRRRRRAAYRRPPAASRGGGAPARPAVGPAGRRAGGRVDQSRESVLRVCRSAATPCPFLDLKYLDIESLAVRSLDVKRICGTLP
jgi:hypothetical protein